MSRPVVIVSHGQPSDPATGEAEITDLAARVAAHAPHLQVRAATLASPGALEAACADTAPLIYPFFMSDGWFTQINLPKRLQGVAHRQLPPFGLDPDLPRFTAHWLAGQIDQQGWQPQDTRLFLAAHGSGRSPRPAQATQDFAQALAAILPLAEIRCGFVEEPPFLQEAAQDMGDQALCLPFFALKRGHVLEDLPEALKAANFTGLRLEPFGLHPDLPAFLAKRFCDNA